MQSVITFNSRHPSIRFLYLNIGANLSPLIPPVVNESVAVLAFEPIVYDKINPLDRLFVVPAAVPSEEGVASMGVHNALGV